jgi:hypothetical protein
MNRTFPVTSSVFASTCAVITFAVFHEACTGSLLTPVTTGDASVGDAPMHDAPVADAPVEDAPVGDAPLGDGGTCPSDVDADLAANGNGPGQVVAVGSARSSSVDCTFCGIGVNLATSTNPDVATLNIGGAWPPMGSFCSTPSDASDVFIEGQLVIGAAKPGVYRSSKVNESTFADCGDLTAGYGLPYEAGTVIVDCGDSGVFHGQASCPPGCISLCTAGEDGGVGICSPCESEQSPPEVQYSECPTSVGPWGSWTVTLTSVVPAVVPADAGLAPGAVFYTVHGSFVATFYDGDEATPPATVTLTF